MSNQVYFTKTLNLSLKREFKEDVFKKIENDLVEMWNKGEQPFDINKHNNLIKISNLRNESFHNFIKFNTIEIIDIELIGINKELLNKFSSKRYDFKITSDTYNLLPTTDGSIKIIDSKDNLYLLTKEEMINNALSVHLI